MHISCITRQQWTDPESLKIEPQQGVGRGGGGIMTKYLNLTKCCPNMHFTNDFADPNLQIIVLVEPLCFFGNDPGSTEEADSKIEKFTQHKGIKLLWCEEQEPFRWDYPTQKRIFGLFDGLVACNKYQHQLLSTLPFNKPIYTLYTPIDSKLYYPEEKKRQVVIAAKVGLQKNTEAIIQLFSELPDDVNTVYIGNAGLWGAYRYEYDKKLELALEKTADEYIHSASAIKTAERIRESQVGINMSIYDTGSLNFLECAMSGCDFFAWNYHLMFDEYKHVKRFDTLNDGIPKIIECLDTTSAPNTNLQTEVAKKHDFRAFHAQLGNLIKEVITTNE